VAEHGRSRFFAWTTPDESPSIGRSGCGSKSKEGDINIFSDDSLNEVMCNLPDVDGFGNGAKIAVFETETPEKSGASSSKTSVKGSTRADDSVISQEFVPNLTPTPSPDTPLPPAIAKLKGAFSFTLAKYSTAKPNLVLQTLSKATTSAPNRPSRIPLAAKSNVSVQSIHSTTKTASLTPLQRLGANATSRAKLPMTPLMTPLGTVACQNSSSQPRRSLLSRGSVPFPEVTQESQAKETEPASIPLPRPDETEELLLSTDMQEGSEDMIVHDSEEEDCLSPKADERVPRVNLGRFVYDG
jgi:exonuclease-1